MIRRWLRRSLLPAGRLLALYLALALVWFFVTLRSTQPLIPDALWTAALPESVTAWVLGRAAADYPRVPIPGSAVIDLGREGVDTVFVEVEGDAPNLAWTTAGSPSGSLRIDAIDVPHGGTRDVRNPSSPVRYVLPGRVGISYSELDLPRGTYRITAAFDRMPDPADRAELVIGPGPRALVHRLARRGVAALVLAVGLATAVALVARRHAERTDRRRRRERQGSRRQTWRELMQERGTPTTAARGAAGATPAARCPRCGGHDVSVESRRHPTDELRGFVRRRAAAAVVIFVLGSQGVVVLVWLFAPGSEALMRLAVVAYLVLVCFWVWLVRRTRIREHPEETVRIDAHVCRDCGHAWTSEPT